jgi:predicted kinase
VKRTVFAFFGYPGAGKSTLCRRFGELHGIPSVDTDAFMTRDEREAVEAGRYTPEMRLANIERYCEHVRRLLTTSPCAALADGLPNDEARQFLREQLTGIAVVFVLVRTPRALWERRLSARSGGPVSISVAEADAYVSQHWEAIPPDWDHEEIDNGADGSRTDGALRDLFEHHEPGS